MRYGKALDKLRAAILLRASSKALLERLDDDDDADARLKPRVSNLHADLHAYVDALASRFRVSANGKRSGVRRARR
jgi:hypothetical protein